VIPMMTWSFLTLRSDDQILSLNERVSLVSTAPPTLYRQGLNLHTSKMSMLARFCNISFPFYPRVPVILKKSLPFSDILHILILDTWASHEEHSA